VALDAADIARIDARIASWRDGVVRPLRAARRALPAGTPVRERLKAEELAAERRHLSMLEICAGGAAAPDAARRSLAAYADFLGVTFPPDALAALTPSSA